MPSAMSHHFAEGEAQVGTQGPVPSQAAGRPQVSALDLFLGLESSHGGDGGQGENNFFFFLIEISRKK